MILNSVPRAGWVRLVAIVGVCLGVSAHQQVQANTIAFITPQLSTPGLTIQVEANYNPGAHTLDWTTRSISPGGGPILSLFAPTATALTGDAGLALAQPVIDLHHDFSIIEGVTLGPLIYLADSLIYDPAFLAANGGTAAGAEAGLIQALLGRQAYLGGFFGEKLFLSPVPDAGDTGALLGLALAALFVTAPRLQRRGLCPAR